MVMGKALMKYINMRIDVKGRSTVMKGKTKIMIYNALIPPVKQQCCKSGNYTSRTV